MLCTWVQRTLCHAVKLGLGTVVLVYSIAGRAGTVPALLARGRYESDV